VNEQIPGPGGNNAKDFVTATLHQRRGLWLRQGRQDRFEYVVAGDCTNRAQRTGKTVEWPGAEVSCGDDVALPRVEVAYGNPLISVRLKRQVDAVALHLKREVFCQIKHVTIRADDIEHACLDRFCCQCRR